MSPYKDAIAALFDDDDDSMLGSPSNKLIYSLGDAGDEQHMRKFARVDEKLLAKTFERSMAVLDCDGAGRSQHRQRTAH
jgi:hypothetical protein